MIRRTTVLPLGLLLATTACSNVLGIKDDSKAADCLVDKDCKQSGQICVDYRCEDSDTASGGSSSDLIGNGAKGGKTSKSTGGSSATTSSARTGGTSSIIGSSSLGGASAAGGTTNAASGGTTNVASGGNTAAGAGGLSGATTAVGGTSSSGGTTTTTSSSGGNTTLGGSTSSGGTTTTTSSSGGKTDVGGTTGTGGSTETTGGNGGTTSNGGSTSVGGTAGSGGTTVAPVCTPGTYTCVYYDDASPRVVNSASCKSNGQWSDEVLCPDYCDEAVGCVSAPSCVGLNPCINGSSCCNSLSLPDGEFNRSIPENGVTDCSADSPCPATVSAFRLDTFEVSVARFRKFVDAYETGVAPYRPAQGDGKNPNSADDTGWRTEWNELLPESREKLEAMIENPGCGAYLYTGSTGVNERKPINCIDWYVALAFCVWDGGRLPTEVEWNYAAAGGDQERYYPWSYPATSNTITSKHATYWAAGATHGATDVGVTIDGMSRWGQYDLAGNMYEWVFDVYAETYPANAECKDCAVADWSANSPEPISRVLRGGGYTSAEMDVTSTARSYDEEAKNWADIGFRCARDF